MKLIYIIICALILANAIIVRNTYVNYYHGFMDHKFAHFLGNMLWCFTEGFIWWYLISNLIEYYKTGIL